jgi:hypothetical protein
MSVMAIAAVVGLLFGFLYSALTRSKYYMFPKSTWGAQTNEHSTFYPKNVNMYPKL